ncbi:A24 family peptidase [Pseudomonas guariconensis]|uniref:prepilin peptidase n=1 Tax=Pseudomonas TaxID=286 RepID=UPI001CE42DFE|nr:MULTISPECIES: A24 family peptidase [Pseudomonas]MCO7639269.1 A24 family peptidase [Pseudomonas sp. S 311-6]MCO7514795.1 A24 family peptidase [Pseudomonas putida]MCO7565356.1 A24 family peptidase [Pseudomonas mosselii]MCO7594526.1 A24 family peptidase [Pseudomonas guariconensis]MCO7607819.1 A24 family peptidase [Pseudomonas guariconensis]
MQSIVLLMWLALCTEQDIRERQLSNALTLGVAAAALAWLFATGHSWIGADPSDAGWALAIVMLLTLPGYMLGRFGAGDVKLMGALALATSHQYVLGTFIGAGITVLAWMLARRRLLALLSPKVRKRLQQLAEEVDEKQPFAPFVLAGFLLTAVWIP